MKSSPACLLAVAAVVWLALTPTARTQTTGTVTTLYSFGAAGSSDGANPYSGLVQGNDGNFYGTTQGGGVAGSGTVFSITPTGTLTTLHNFSATDSTGHNSDGKYPSAGLVRGSDGNFYGATQYGGSNANGTVFSITPAGAFTTLHNFNATDSTGHNSDGANPYPALALGSDGNFYGTTSNGGSNRTGTVFSITPAGAFTTLHNFSAVTNQNSSGLSVNNDGVLSRSALLQGRDGIFYGTRALGGSNGSGTIFSITPAGSFTVLHSFSAVDSNSHNSDGRDVAAGLVQNSDGNFYGATVQGGSDGRGTVFSITPAGAFTTLHHFSAIDSNSRNSGGASPYGTLVRDSDDTLYGTTQFGGSGGGGTIFSITPAGLFTSLHGFDFSSISNGNKEGVTPYAGLVRGSDGSFYGTTTFGGSNTKGAIFRAVIRPAFFAGEVALSQGVYYLAFPNGNILGYYSYLSDPRYIYHQDMGFEYVFNANDGQGGVYLYDFKSNGFFYTSPVFAFPYLYDFSLNATLFYYPDPNNPQRYNTNGVRYFYNFSTGRIITK